MLVLEDAKLFLVSQIAFLHEVNLDIAAVAHQAVQHFQQAGIDVHTFGALHAMGRKHASLFNK